MLSRLEKSPPSPTSPATSNLSYDNMLQAVRYAGTLARAAEAAPIPKTAPTATVTATKGRSRNQPARPPKPVSEEFLQRQKAKKTHKRFTYPRMFEKTAIQVGPISESTLR